MDINKLAENLDMEVEDYVELVELFINTSAMDIDRLQSQVIDSDIQNASRSAHSIRGAALNLGIDEISTLAEKIEGQIKRSQWEKAQLLSKMLKRNLNALTTLVVH